MAKTMAQVVEDRGRAEGRAEGETMGLRRVLEAVLTERFGELEPWMLAVVAAADLDTPDTWLRRAVTAPTLADIGIPPDQPSH